jgi:hypothetical protein
MPLIVLVPYRSKANTNYPSPQYFSEFKITDITGGNVNGSEFTQFLAKVARVSERVISSLTSNSIRTLAGESEQIDFIYFLPSAATLGSVYTPLLDGLSAEHIAGLSVGNSAVAQFMPLQSSATFSLANPYALDRSVAEISGGNVNGDSASPQAIPLQSSPSFVPSEQHHNQNSVRSLSGSGTDGTQAKAQYVSLQSSATVVASDSGQQNAAEIDSQSGGNVNSNSASPQSIPLQSSDSAATSTVELSGLLASLLNQAGQANSSTPNAQYVPQPVGDSGALTDIYSEAYTIVILSGFSDRNTAQPQTIMLQSDSGVVASDPDHISMSVLRLSGGQINSAAASPQTIPLSSDASVVTFTLASDQLNALHQAGILNSSVSFAAFVPQNPDLEIPVALSHILTDQFSATHLSGYTGNEVAYPVFIPLQSDSGVPTTVLPQDVDPEHNFGTYASASAEATFVPLTASVGIMVVLPPQNEANVFTLAGQPAAGVMSPQFIPLSDVWVDTAPCGQFSELTLAGGNLDRSTIAAIFAPLPRTELGNMRPPYSTPSALTLSGGYTDTSTSIATFVTLPYTQPSSAFAPLPTAVTETLLAGLTDGSNLEVGNLFPIAAELKTASSGSLLESQVQSGTVNGPQLYANEPTLAVVNTHSLDLLTTQYAAVDAGLTDKNTATAVYRGVASVTVSFTSFQDFPTDQGNVTATINPLIEALLSASTSITARMPLGDIDDSGSRLSGVSDRNASVSYLLTVAANTLLTAATVSGTHEKFYVTGSVDISTVQYFDIGQIPVALDDLYQSYGDPYAERVFEALT